MSVTLRDRQNTFCLPPIPPHMAGMTKPTTTTETPANHDTIDSADGGIGVSILRILKLLGRSELAKSW